MPPALHSPAGWWAGQPPRAQPTRPSTCRTLAGRRCPAGMAAVRSTGGGLVHRLMQAGNSSVQRTVATARIVVPPPPQGAHTCLAWHAARRHALCAPSSACTWRALMSAAVLSSAAHRQAHSRTEGGGPRAASKPTTQGRAAPTHRGQRQAPAPHRGRCRAAATGCQPCASCQAPARGWWAPRQADRQVHGKSGGRGGWGGAGRRAGVSAGRWQRRAALAGGSAGGSGVGPPWSCGHVEQCEGRALAPVEQLQCGHGAAASRRAYSPSSEHRLRVWGRVMRGTAPKFWRIWDVHTLLVPFFGTSSGRAKRRQPCPPICFIPASIGRIARSAACFSGLQTTRHVCMCAALPCSPKGAPTRSGAGHSAQEKGRCSHLRAPRARHCRRRRRRRFASPLQQGGGSLTAARAFLQWLHWW